MMFDGYGAGHGIGVGIVGILIVLAYVLFVGGVIWLLALAIRWFLRQERGPRPSGGGPTAPNDPLEILRARYARGEIDDEEYERRRRTLTGG